MENTNFLIEGMNTIELEKEIEKRSKTNVNIKELFDRNQYKYITAFFSEFLCVNGKYIKGTKLKDLLILYYIDYYIKEKLAEKALKVEKHLNVIMLNLYDKGIIRKRTGDKQNSFGEVLKFYIDLGDKTINKNQKSMLEDQKSIMKEFNNVHKTNFESVELFIFHLKNIVALRNFTLHHYSVVSYSYASKIKNGEAHRNKNGIDRNLPDTMESLSLFITKHSTNKLMTKFNKIINKYEYSNATIYSGVNQQMKKILNFEALSSITRKNIHYSVIDLIKDNKINR